jgi:hypothetical protein
VLRVRHHVRRRHVAQRPDVARHLSHPAAAEQLLLALAQVVRVADHATLGPTQGDVHDGALPGHPHGQGANRVQRLLGVEADATLRGAARIIVLDAEAPEYGDPSVVHPHRDQERVLADGPAQQLARRRVEGQEFGHTVELSLGHLEGVVGPSRCVGRRHVPSMVRGQL